MSVSFSENERAQIQTAIDSSTGLSFQDGAYKASNVAVSNAIPLYQILSQIIETKIDSGTFTGSDLQDLKNDKLWLDVAIGANGNAGIHAVFIRTYTNIEGELRLGRAFSESEMQLASNTVATNLANSLINGDQDNNLLPWTLPSISQIANVDARAIGKVLFESTLGTDDTSVTSNSAWSGALGFNFLGGSPPYESWRLVLSGDSDNASAIPNTLDDFKNILFAVDAYNHALSASRYAALDEFLSNFYTTDIGAQFNIDWANNNILGLVNDIAARTPAIAPSVNLITGVGEARFLDMLAGAGNGQQLIGTTTDQNFATTAKDFFASFSPADLQSVSANILPTGVLSLISAANTDVNVRAALSALSAVSVQVNPDVAQNFSLYDPSTRAGEITNKWITDHALVNSAFMQYWQRGETDGVLSASDVPSGLPWQALPANIDIIVDGAHQQTLTLSLAASGTAPNDIYYFGDDSNNPFPGAGGNDHIYGGGGNDSISGDAGNDYLEGDQGDDYLAGGADNDTLVGGDGNDTYIFTSSNFGNDTIIDDNGALKIGNTIVGQDSQAQGTSAKITDNHDGTYTMVHLGENYTLHLDSSSHDLLIQKGNDSITIKNFIDGTFGIALSDEKLVAIANTASINLNVLPDATLEVSMQVPEDIYGDGKVVHYLLDSTGNYTQYLTDSLSYGPLSATTSDGNLAVFTPRVNPVSGNFSNDKFTINLYDKDGNLLHTLDLQSAGIPNPDSNTPFYPAFLLPDENGGVTILGQEYYINNSPAGNEVLVRLDKNLNVTSPVVVTNPEWTNYYPYRLRDTDIVKADDHSYYKINNSPEYTGYGGNTVINHLTEQRYDFSGAAIGDPLTLGDFTFNWSSYIGYTGVASAYIKDLNADSKIIYWDYINPSPGFDFTFQFQIIYSDGSRSRIISREGTDSNFGTDEGVTVLDGGAFVVTIRDPDTKNYSSQVYDNNGNTIGGAINFEVENVPNNALNSKIFAISPISGVGYVAAWVGGTFGQENPIYTKIIPVDTASIVGSSRPQLITGSDGSDLLIPGQGDHVVEGGAGYDTYVYHAGDGNHTIVDSGSNRLVLKDIMPDQISLAVGSLILKVAGTDGQIHLLNFDANNPDAGAGITDFEFADGSVYTLNQILDIGFPLAGTTDNDLLQGTNSKDIITGLAGDDTLIGNGGNDVLNGGPGNDVLNGGPGDDQYLIDEFNGNDSIQDSDGANDQIVFGGSITADRVKVFNDIAHHQVLIDILQPGSTVIEGTVTVALDPVSNLSVVESLKFSDGTIVAVEDVAVTLNPQVTLNGTSANDVLNGTAADEIINGLAGNDIINGNDGNDVITGGTGNDSMAGGAGDDVFLIQGTDQGADRVQGDDGFDQVLGGAGDDQFTFSTFTGIYTVERVDGQAGVNKIVGTSADNTLDFSNTELLNIASIDGGAGNDNIIGSAGADVIIGGTGNDSMAGGPGDDIFQILGTDQGADRVQGGDGFDQVLGGSGDDVFTFSTFTGVYTVEQIDGQAGINKIVGTSADNTLDFSNTQLFDIASIDGGAGNDNIIGSAGNDVIIGGTGNDSMAGGGGDDVFLIQGTDQGADRVQGDDGFDQVLGGAGDDVFTFSTFTGVYTVEQIDGQAGINKIVGTSADNTLDFSTSELLNIASIDGGAGNDNIIGSAGNDVIIGGTGNDSMAGGAGDDVFLIQGTDQGADRVQGGDGFDQVLGGAGDDVFTFSTFTGVYTVEQIDGQAGINKIVGTSADNTLDFSNTQLFNIASIDGGAGNDNIIGSAGNDVIIGGTGNDSMAGGAEDDVFLIQGSDQGADRIEGDTGFDQVLGGAGDDVFTFSTYTGIYTVERIDGQAGVNKVVGTSADNTLDFSNTQLVNIASIDGGAGNDNITGSAGADVIIGGTGNDSMAGGAGDDVFLIQGTDQGADRVQGDDGFDQVLGGSGDDVFTFSTYTGVYTVERIDGQAGINKILGTSADNTLDFSNTQLLNIVSIDGGAGNDKITGSASADIIIGGTGNDTLLGGAGDDTLIGGVGNDVLTGGAGADVFSFNTAPSSTNIDQITDFNIAEDKISLDHTIFTKLTALGALSSSNFVAGFGVTAAADSDDYFIYNRTTGALYYDADGNGSGASVQIATLVGTPNLTVSNFLVA